MLFAARGASGLVRKRAGRTIFGSTGIGSGISPVPDYGEQCGQTLVEVDHTA